MPAPLRRWPESISAQPGESAGRGASFMRTLYSAMPGLWDSYRLIAWLHAAARATTLGSLTMAPPGGAHTTDDVRAVADAKGYGSSEVGERLWQQ